MNVQLPTRTSQGGRQDAKFFAPLQREFDRLFDQLGSGWTAGFGGPAPRMDVRETKNAVEVTLEVPGMAEEDLKITLGEGVLQISGEKKVSSEKTEGEYHVTERGYGAFARSVRLPTHLDSDKLKATLKDGVLTITAPKNGEGKARAVAIEVAR